MRPLAWLFFLSLYLLTANHVLSQLSRQQPTLNWSLKFEDFAVGRIYEGTPARPVLLTEKDRMYRTTIRQAAREGTDFAGHYRIVHWGRGSGLTSFVVADVATGRVYDITPFDFFDVPFQGTSTGRDYQGLVYKPGSRLLVADGCPDNGKCGTYYYEWKEDRLALLRFDPLERSTK